MKTLINGGGEIAMLGLILLTMLAAPPIAIARFAVVTLRAAPRRAMRTTT